MVQTVEAGAYGLAVVGVADPVGAGLNPLPDAHDWPRVEVRRVPWTGSDDELPPNAVDEHLARLRLLGGGYLEVDRAAATATFHLVEPGTDRDVAHPLLAPVGAIMAWWRRRETFHCAGFVGRDGGAWALAADKEAGKSTLAALLALQGVPLLADDLLVLEDGLHQCLAGPRLVDLRQPTATHLREDLGVELVDVRGGERARLDLDPVPLVSPFRGFVLLVEGDGPSVRSVPVSERMERLTVHRGLRHGPHDPTVLLDLATRPVLELSRPKRFDQVDEVIDLLLEATATA